MPEDVVVQCSVVVGVVVVVVVVFVVVVDVVDVANAVVVAAALAAVVAAVVVLGYLSSWENRVNCCKLADGANSRVHTQRGIDLTKPHNLSPSYRPTLSEMSSDTAPDLSALAPLARSVHTNRCA